MFPPLIVTVPLTSEIAAPKATVMAVNKIVRAYLKTARRVKEKLEGYETADTLTAKVLVDQLSPA